MILMSPPHSPWSYLNTVFTVGCEDAMESGQINPWFRHQGNQAVDKVGRGKQRQVNVRFRAMVSHFMFESDFCNPAAGWEKGQIEKNVRDARYRLWHDAPAFRDLAELNAWLEQRCKALWHEIRHPEQTDRTIAEVYADERPALMAMPPPFDGFIEHAKRVSPTCLIVFERNRYSVPATLANQVISLRVYADRLVMVARAEVIADQDTHCHRYWCRSDCASSPAGKVPVDR